MTDRPILWKSGTGRVIRQGDVVKVEGLRGEYLVSANQPFADQDLIQVCQEAVVELAKGRKVLGHGSYRQVRPERLHIRRVSTEVRYRHQLREAVAA